MQEEGRNVSEYSEQVTKYGKSYFNQRFDSSFRSFTCGIIRRSSTPQHGKILNKLFKNCSCDIINAYAGIWTRLHWIVKALNHSTT